MQVGEHHYQWEWPEWEKKEVIGRGSFGEIHRGKATESRINTKL